MPKPIDLHALGLKWLACAICGRPATCIGAYENAIEKAPACDDCCGHACEDGHCEPIGECSDEVLAKFARA